MTTEPLAYGELIFAPLGRICLQASILGIKRVQIHHLDEPLPNRVTSEPALQAFLHVTRGLEELNAYLSGELRVPFLSPLDWTGISSFQKNVLQAALAIPYAQTRTYTQLAREIAHPKATRAVGRALATNPFLLFVPCHRVIGSDGQLHGFAAPGGIKTKAWLLELEGVRSATLK